MRQAYKDPMNSKDGEWRLIYVGPAGQLIGSLKPQRALQLSGLGGFQNVAAPNLGAVPSLPGGQQPFGQGLGQPFCQTSNQIGGNSRVGNFGSNNFGATPGGTSNAQNQLGGASADTSLPGGLGDAALPDDAANEELLNSEPKTIMGGNIIGVGSKIKQS